MKTFEILYEILPLRAIYQGEIDAESEKEALQEFRKQGANYRLRRINGTPVVDDGRTVRDNAGNEIGT